MITPSADALWVGQRLARMFAADGPGLAESIAWCEEQVRRGHMCLDFDHAVADGDRQEELLPPEWLDGLRRLPCVAVLGRGSLDDCAHPLVLEGSRLYFAAQRADELAIARRLVALSRRPSPWAGVAKGASPGNELQDRAVALVSKASLAIVTGGPGTGKTTVARGMVERVLRHDPTARVLLLAPTGKATARLRESINASAPTGVTAMTIHRALTPASRSTLAGARLLIVDEASMVPAQLMRRLLTRMPADASLVLLGDAQQLASIEAGSVLADIVPDSDSHPLAACSVPLTRNWRFEEGGPLSALASAVSSGDWDGVQRALGAGGSVSWTRADTPGQVVERTLECRAAMAGASTILCAHRHGSDGSLTISRDLARRAGAGGNADPVHGRDFPGRPIVVTVNDEATGLVNGDVGHVESQGGRLVAVFPGRPGDPIPVDGLPPHEAAYAITIHRSQGSEYDEVVVALSARESQVLSRELLYTAITRARKKVVIVSSEASLKAAVARQVRRASGLRERIVAAGLLPAE